MFRDQPHIENSLEAVDELVDLAATLEGMSTMTLALAASGMCSDDAVALVSNLLVYCSHTAEAASKVLMQPERKTHQACSA